MSGKDVIRRAMSLPLDDASYPEVGEFTMSGPSAGCGLVMALKSAAGDDVEAYNDAYGPLSIYCDSVVPLWLEGDMCRPPYHRGRCRGELKTWAADKTVSERRALLERFSR